MGSSACNRIERAVAGDRDALRSLLEAHTPALRRHLAGKIPKHLQALLSVDDVLQETYTDTFLHIAQFVSRDEAAFVEWLRTIATRNTINAIKWLKAEKRGGDRRQFDHPDRDASCIALYDLLAATHSTPSRQFHRAEARAALEQAIRQLPADHRLVVEMYDLNGQEMKDVADRLGRNVGALHMMRYRAHGWLAAQLGSESKYFTAV